MDIEENLDLTEKDEDEMFINLLDQNKNNIY
jgi:hypothetical protein